MENKKHLGINNVDIRIAIGFVLAMLIADLIPGDLIQKLAACTAVIMCTQDDAGASWKSGLIRVEGVIIGGVCAVLVVLADNVIGNDYMFMLLCGLGVAVHLLCCRLVRLPAIAARVSCITFALVALVMPGPGRITYALLRLLGTVVGAAVALAVSWVYDLCFGKKKTVQK